MFTLDTTKALARWKFHQHVLGVLERDALGVAALRLLNANPDFPLSSEYLLREANCILPEPGHQGAMRLFFVTNRQIQNNAVDTICDFSSFLYTNARRALEGPLQMDVLSDLAQAYSYVIEAAIVLVKFFRTDR